MQDQKTRPAPCWAWKKHVADFRRRPVGCIDKIRRYSQLYLARWLHRRYTAEEIAGISGSQWYALIRTCGFSARAFPGDFRPGVPRIDRKPPPETAARRSRRQPHRSGGRSARQTAAPSSRLVRVGLNVEIGQEHAAGWGPDIDALPRREQRDQHPSKAGERWKCGHVRGTRLSNARASFIARCFNSSLRENNP